VKFTTFAFAAMALVFQALAAGVSIEFTDGTFRVTGIDPGPEPETGWQSVFAVYVAEGDVPPMLGTYQATSEGLVFTPRFPAAPGVHYRAVFKSAAPPLEKLFNGPARTQTSPTRVLRIYPTADVLPSNQLKFYVEFTGPMQAGEVWQHIRLVDHAGKKVELAFLEIEPELWDPDHRRLTILFDPGRIKRGVKPQMETGSALIEGRRYALIIDKGLRDATGSELAVNVEKYFSVGPSIRTGINLSDWKITAPAAGFRVALEIAFPRPLDEAILVHAFQVRDASGNIEGTQIIRNNEARWQFIPEAPWHSGPHTLVIDMALEDLAGNRIGRPFDVDLINQSAERITAATTSLPFEIR
jgi:hypothetical protein